MRKFTAIMLVILTGVTLCGCSSGYETDSSFIVSAVGFDLSDGGFSVSVEALVTESGKDGPESAVFSGEGETPDGAISEIMSLLPKNLAFDHCGTVVLGNGLLEKNFSDIMEFCRKKSSLNLAVLLVCTENAKNLLSGDPPSSYSVGYDVMGILEQNGKKKNIDYGNRFYELENRMGEADKIMLPYFSLKDGCICLDGFAAAADGR